jgi:DNA replication protein DnaC
MADRMDFTRTDARTGLKRLRTVPKLNGEYPARIEPGKSRSREKIAQPLRKLLGELLAGKKRLPLVISGPPGTGKTCAALCFADAVWDAYFLSFPDLVQLEFAPWDQQNSMRRELERAELVILDDVAVGVETENSLRLRREVLWRTLDLRERRANGQTVVTTNCKRDLLTRAFGQAVESRMFCGTHFELLGVDQRLSRPHNG